MTSHDVHPAASEPNSIAPMALDTNQWKIDLNDLHASGLRLDFSVPTFDDEEETPTVKPRTGRRVLGVMTAMLLVAGLGFAAFRGRPALQRAYASSSASWRATRTTATSAPAKPVVVAVTALQAPPPPAPPLPVMAPAPPVVAPAPPVGPTMDANALPNAPKIKRGPAKRRKH